MHTRNLTLTPRLATAAVLAALALTGCGPDSTDDPTPTSTVTVTVPTTTPTSSEPPTTPTTTASETDNHITGGNPDNAPDDEQVQAAEQVATDFWLAITERTWDHPDGATQWLTAISPYTSPDYQQQLQDTYGQETGGVEWDNLYFAHGSITAQVRDASFDTGYRFDTDNLTVLIEGASALHDDTYDLDIDDAPSRYVPVTLTRTDNGWKVAEYGNQ